MSFDVIPSATHSPPGGRGASSLIARRGSRSDVFFLLAYIAALTIAELLVTYSMAVLVFVAHGGLLLAIAAFILRNPVDRTVPGALDRLGLALALAVGPMIRIISLTLPLSQLDPTLRYVMAGVPIAMAGVLAARLSGLSGKSIGLVWHRTSIQLRVVAVSVALGFIEFSILRSEPLGPPPWTSAGAIASLSVGFATGFPEELVFRGVMQTATRPFLGRWNWVYVSAIFAVLHLGYQSYIDVVFVFAVGLVYGWVFERTRSIIGVSIGHGVANIVLFFVAPNLIAPSTLPVVAPSVETLLAAVLTGALVVAGVMYWRRRDLDPWLGDDAESAVGPVPVAAMRAVRPAGRAFQVIVNADPSAHALDFVNHRVPATVVEFPVAAEATITPSASDVIASRARGIVRFTSRDHRQVIIQPGMAVGTPNGLLFRTTDGAIIPPAAAATERSVELPIEAEVATTDANLPAGRITVLPAQLERMAVNVTNDWPVAGGARAEGRRITAADYEAGVDRATAALWAELGRRLADEHPSTGAPHYVHPQSAELTKILIDPPASDVIDLRADAVVLTARATGKAVGVGVGDLRSALVEYLAGALPPGAIVQPETVDGRVIAVEPHETGLRVALEATAWQVRSVEPDAH